MAKDLIHPAVITSALWSTLLLIYNTLDHGLYQFIAVPLKSKIVL